jgi:stage III sporulation protein AH
MKKNIKKNQIVITALAVMIAVAGYINYFSGIKNTADTADPTAVSYYENSYDVVSNDVEPDDSSLLEPGTAVLTSTQTANLDILSEVKLNREQVRAANKENLLSIIDNEAISEENKKGAIDEMVAMNDVAEKEMAAELLLEAKGFGETVVSIVDGSVDVVVNCAELTDTQRAQIEDIVKRKTSIEASNITITPMIHSEENTVQ